jgi:predicted secreted protein
MAQDYSSRRGDATSAGEPGARGRVEQGSCAKIPLPTGTAGPSPAGATGRLRTRRLKEPPMTQPRRPAAPRRHLAAALPGLAAAAAFALAALPAPLRADDDGLRLPPEGHTLLNFSATERLSLPQDLLTAALRIESRSADPRKVQADINAAMDKALATAKKVAGVKVTTGGYHVYEQRLERGVRLWQGQQGLQLESKNAAAVLELAGQLQASGFAMSGLSYSLSPERAESVRDELMVKALGALKAKAALVARSLGKSGYELVDVNLGGDAAPMEMYRARPMAMAVAADASPPPVAEPGETDVAVTVSARALLKP